MNDNMVTVLLVTVVRIMIEHVYLILFTENICASIPSLITCSTQSLLESKREMSRQHDMKKWKITVFIFSRSVT
jgi:hypothetical protein